ncbi:MAG TPA: ubiquinol-cytochrome C chaperone family protein [Paraburkholderia sp.]|uniref:ubiquinol-cytochrome C chaperone family protein n=1 Tax=Paraburkholderia sp. TaxID=1926495 RepID=UPI002B47E523|nr:ubiquinol-cytochrome C chaperone family protein [Paraburkholderia sp.]HKR46746.1 ubiquinol-cytochrome C chaperone family protein [Paraburkholderia sp.]
MPLIEDPDLAEVLTSASDDDIGLLIDLITDNGSGRISVSTAVTRQLVAAKVNGPDDVARALIAEELSRFGGNSMMNFVRRGKGVRYAEVAADVMSHTGAPKSASGDCAAMELAVIGKVFEQSLSRMSEEDKSTLFSSMGAPYRAGMGPAALAALMGTLGASGAASYRLSALVASATMSSLVGRGVILTAGSTALGRGLAVLTGPLGWAITGIWTAFDLASPAYRVTVPCVIQIGYMRQKMLLASACPTCHTPLTPGGNFCGKCGVRLITGPSSAKQVLRIQN